MKYGQFLHWNVTNDFIEKGKKSNVGLIGMVSAAHA